MEITNTYFRSKKCKAVFPAKLLIPFLLILTLILLLTACASVPIDRGDVEVIELCKQAEIIYHQSGAVEIDRKGITDMFTVGDEGKLFIQVRMPLSSGSTRHKFQYKWYTASKLVFEKEDMVSLSGGLAGMMVRIIPLNKLGTGNHSVEIYADNNLIGTKAFVVKEK